MRHRRSEQGAVAVLVAVLVAGVLLPVGALAVDIGMQRVARRDMQAVADEVALDLARHLDGRSTAVALYPSLDAWADQSADRNAGNSFSEGATVSAVLGTLDTSKFGQTGYFTELPPASTTVPTAVQVVAATSVDFAFTSGSGGVSRTSVATADSTACFELGSYALRLSSSNSPLLSSLLNGILSASVSAADYTELADADAVVPLASLATELGLGSVDELAGATVTLHELYVAIQHVLANEGRSADATIVGALAASVGGGGSVVLGNMLDLAAGGDAALSGSLRALDLVATSAFLSNGTNLLSLPSTTLGGTGLGSATSSLKVIEGLRLACGAAGSAQASTSQLDLTVSGKPTTLPSILGLTATAPGVSTLQVQVATGSGTLSGIVCGSATAAGPSGIDVATVSGLVSPLRLTVPVHLAATIGGIGLSLDITVTVQKTAVASSATASVRVPTTNSTWAVPTTTGTGTLGLRGGTVTKASSNLNVSLGVLGALGLSLPTIESQVVSQIVDPLVTALDGQLLGPLSELLGARLGGVDVFGIEAPVCSQPRIVG